MKRSLTLSVVALICLMLAWCTAQLTRPWLFLPADRMVVFVSEDCGISRDVVSSAAASEVVRRALTVVPVDAEDTPRRAVACGLSIANLRESAPWFTLFSDAWLCEQLVRDAAPIHRAAFTGVPAYMMDGEAASFERVDAELSKYDLVRRRGMILRQALIDDMRGREQVQAPEGELHAVYGQSIGF